MNNSPETRLSLIARLHDREDDNAWNEFVQLYQPLIQAIVQRRGLRYNDAADVTQDVLGRVAKSIEKWEPDPQKGSFRGWLYRVTRNLTIDHLRRNQRHKVTEINEEFDIEQVAEPSVEESREFRLEYEKQLFNWAASQVRSSFKEDNWQAFWESTVEGKDIGEVAKKLNVSRGTIYVARSRIMARIAAVIEKRLREITP